MTVFVVRHSYPWSEGEDMVSVYSSAEAMMKKLELIGECRWDEGETVKVECIEVLDESTMQERLDNLRRNRAKANDD